MIRWVVGDHQQPKRRVVARLPVQTDGSHKTVLEKLPQPMTITEDSSGSIPFTVKDRDDVTRMQGRPVGTEAASWYMLKEVSVGHGDIEYHVLPVEQNWVNFEKVSGEPNTSLDLEQTEKLMKERQLKSRSEYNDYLKLVSRKAQESGISTIKKDDSDEPKQAGPASRKLKFRRGRSDEPDSAVSFQKADDEGGDREWEGEEAFSDDDDQMFKDDVNDREELDIDDDDIIGADDTEPLDSEDEEQILKDSFGDEIKKIMTEAHAKEKNVDEQDLDDELKKYGDLGSLDDEEMAEPPQVSSSAPAQTSAPPQPPLIIARKTSKEDQIRARIKGMFWRSEYKLKLKDILAQFSGLNNRASEEYQILTKSLKELAEVKDGMLHLKPQFRK